MIKYKIIDNFLSDSDFTELTNNILPSVDGNSNANNFTWKYLKGHVRKDFDKEDLDESFKKVTNIEVLKPIHDWFLTHILHIGMHSSPLLSHIHPLINTMSVLAFFRIVVNLTIQQEKKGRTLFHIDLKDKNVSMLTSIFYVNTTNGPTLLEDGTEIECRANRLVTFPYETYHAGVLCTDQPYRIVINLNYFKEMKWEDK